MRQLLVIALIAAFMVGCARVEGPTPPPAASASASRRRPVDGTPRRSVLDTGLPPGIAEASFQLDTGGDQGPLPLEYQSLVEIPLRYQVTGSDADKDLLYALH